ncbi:MAG: hypothetical protein IPL79_07720 [Myxococcales bacterium]|nr:hypothetical protein [Myxococcales bacterium]
MRVLLAFADVGLSLQLQESLEALEIEAIWDATAAAGPVVRSHGDYDVVLIDIDTLGPRLEATLSSWRTIDPTPGLVACGMRGDNEAKAKAARIAYARSDVAATQLAQIVGEAARLRFAAAMTRGLARAALGLTAAATPEDDAAQIVAAQGTADLELVRGALRWHTYHYGTSTDVLAMLRQKRALQIPEVQFCAHLDGTFTVQQLLKKGPIDAWHAARLLWVLASVGAITLTPDPIDRATPRRRALAHIRDHLRARMARLEGSTFFDVLEVTPAAEPKDIEIAYALVARRYSPQVLATFDLGDVGKHVEAMWQLAQKARAVLTDMADRGRYNDWVAARQAQLKSTWVVDPQTVHMGSDAAARGQQAMAAGDIHRAVGDLAAACRYHPGHPEYETTLAWARYRVQLAGGGDRVEAARVARASAEAVMAGIRPWPRAMLALALLCAADNDADSARFHLREALSVDPSLIAAQQLLQKLS